MTTSNGILSGLVLKAYIILAIKLVFEVFTIETLVKLRIADVLFVLGALGMIMTTMHTGRLPGCWKRVAGVLLCLWHRLATSLWGLA